MCEEGLLYMGVWVFVGVKGGMRVVEFLGFKL